MKSFHKYLFLLSFFTLSTSARADSYDDMLRAIHMNHHNDVVALLKKGVVDLSLLDEKVEELCAKMLLTFPDCTTKTVEELRKPKLDAWNRNKENSRAWLALNMVTEARAGFTAFNSGLKDEREVDFVLLRQKLAAGEGWVGGLHDSIQPGAK